MKCQKCGSEWNSKIASIICPFCGEKLEFEANKNFTNISEVLRYIVDTYGIEVYKNTSLLLAYVSDLAPRLENEKRLLKICAESGIVTQFAENSNIVTDEQEIFVKKSETTLCNQYFLNENAARNVLSWLVYSVDWAYKPQEETSNKPRNVSEHKYESIPQKATTLTSCKKSGS